jgi:hypothetical protein
MEAFPFLSTDLSSGSTYILNYSVNILFVQIAYIPM